MSSDRPQAPPGVGWRYLSERWEQRGHLRWAWVKSDVWDEPILAVQHETRNRWMPASKVESRIVRLFVDEYLP